MMLPISMVCWVSGEILPTAIPIKLYGLLAHFLKVSTPLFCYWPICIYVCFKELQAATIPAGMKSWLQKGVLLIPKLISIFLPLKCLVGLAGRGPATNCVCSPEIRNVGCVSCPLLGMSHLLMAKPSSSIASFSCEKPQMARSPIHGWGWRWPRLQCHPVCVCPAP